MSLAEEILTKKQKLGIDEETLLKLNNMGFANIVDPRFGISRKKVIALKLLLFDFNQTDNKPSLVEKKIVEDFLVSSRGDMWFNKELQQIARMELAGKGNGAVLVANLIQYTYKTRHIVMFDQAFKKLEKIYDGLMYNIKVAEERKLTIKDYANIYDIAQLHPILVTFYNKGLFSGIESLDTFYQQVVKCAAVVMPMKAKYKMG